MKINGKIIQEQPFWTERKVKIWQTGWLILFLIGYPVFGYSAYQQFKTDDLNKTTVEGMTVKHYLTMQSAVRIKISDDLIIDATLGELIDYAIQESVMLEEENRIPD